MLFAFSRACAQSPGQDAADATREATLSGAATAALAGQVIDANGAMIAGARIVLQDPAFHKEQTTDSNGRFAFHDLPAGAYTLSVTLTGFTPVTQQVALAAGQDLTLQPAVLKLATVAFTVNAITPEQLAAQELHAEEHQRLVGALPNFFVSYHWNAPPLSARQKFVLATHNAMDPGNLALVGVTAGVQQAANAFPGYQQGAAGYGRRYGADLGNLVIGTYMGGAMLPALFHQDPRYFYKGTGTRSARFWYAVSRAVITRGDNGHEQPNFAGVLGDLSAAAISNAYYPASDRQGARLFMVNGALAIGGDAMNDFFQEFVLPHLTSKK